MSPLAASKMACRRAQQQTRISKAILSMGYTSGVLSVENICTEKPEFPQKILQIARSLRTVSQ